MDTALRALNDACTHHSLLTSSAWLGNTHTILHQVTILALANGTRRNKHLLAKERAADGAHTSQAELIAITTRKDTSSALSGEDTPLLALAGLTNLCDSSAAVLGASAEASSLDSARTTGASGKFIDRDTFLSVQIKTLAASALLTELSVNKPILGILRAFLHDTDTLAILKEKTFRASSGWDLDATTALANKTALTLTALVGAHKRLDGVSTTVLVALAMEKDLSDGAGLKTTTTAPEVAISTSADASPGFGGKTGAAVEADTVLTTLASPASRDTLTINQIIVIVASTGLINAGNSKSRDTMAGAANATESVSLRAELTDWARWWWVDSALIVSGKQTLLALALLGIEYL